MEIDQAVKECGDRRLQAKYQNAVYVIGRAFALYEFDQVAFSFNGGKDSTVLLHLLRAGYFLHKVESECSKGNHTVLGTLKCPIRTIYFESPCAFREIDSFTYDTATTYDLQLETISLDFKSGLESLLKERPTKAIFLGTRIGDPNAIGQEQFSPSSPGWPPFMRVNPILDWSYRDVWDFIRTCKVKYCSLYDQGYTSIGSIYDTVPNVMLSIPDSNTTKESFKPAYMLLDGRLERAGRTKKKAPKCDNSPISSNGLNNSSQIGSLTASIVVVGDEILFGQYEDKLAAALCKKLPSIGWRVTHVEVVPNNVDLIADAVEKQKNKDDMVFLLGGLGPLHLDVSMAGVARAFGVRLAPDEEFEEYILGHLNQPHPNKRSEMALLPEGITELLHHMNLPVPLIKCQNVVILTATNTSELEIQWDCLIELPDTPIMSLAPFVSKHLTTTLSSVETAQAISKMCLEFSDLYIGCHQKTRTGPLIVSFVGKDIKRIDSAIEKLVKDFSEGAFSEVSCT